MGVAGPWEGVGLGGASEELHWGCPSLSGPEVKGGRVLNTQSLGSAASPQKRPGVRQERASRLWGAAMQSSLLRCPRAALASSWSAGRLGTAAFSALGVGLHSVGYNRGRGAILPGVKGRSIKEAFPEEAAPKEAEGNKAGGH